MVRYDTKIDIAIANTLFKNDGLGYRETKRRIESKDYLNRGIPPETYHHHIRMMRRENQLERAEYIRGKKIPLHLTHETRQEIRLGTFYVNTLDNYHKNMSRKKEKEESKQVRLKKAYQLLLVVASIRFPLPFCDDDYLKFPGITVRDILGAYRSGFAFGHIAFSKTMVKESFRLLNKENLIKPVLTFNGETRFDIVEKSLKEFVEECLKIYNGAVMFRLFITWQNIRRPTMEERKWCESSWGKEQTDSIFRNVCETLFSWRKEADKEEKLRRRRESKKKIKCMDGNLFDLLNKLKQKYSKLIEKYPSLTKTLIEIIYPRFLQSYATNKEPYPKLLMWVSL